MIFPYSIGVYIESEWASIALMKVHFRSLRLIDQKIFSLHADRKVDERIEEVNGVLKDMIRKYRIADPIVHLGIPRDQSILRFIEFPIAVKENLKETVAYEIEKHVPFAESDIYFDYQIISEAKKNGRIKVLLVVVKKEILLPYFKIMEGIKGDLSGIDISSNMIANFFDTEKQIPPSHSFGVVYEGGKTMEFCGIRNSRLWYSRGINTSNTDSGFNEILSLELKSIIEKLEIKDDQSPFQIVLCVKDVSEELIRQLSGTVYKNIVRIDFAGKSISDPAMIPAYALSMKGLQKVPMDMNLLPVSLQKRPHKIGLYSFYILLGLMCWSLLMWGGGRFANNRQTSNQLNIAIENIQHELKQMEAIALESQKIQQKIDYLKSFAPQSGQLIDIINELSQRIPDTAWITNFSYSNGKIRIEGLADNASELIPLLEASPYFNDASFLSTIRKDRTGQENFSIGLDVKGSSSF